ncbi:MAG TPA: DUF1697 domain-containing protein [Longimicrobiales bacterium]
MATHVVLLRGINVGPAKRVPMAELRALIEALGYANARTLLNSGNALFDAPGVPAEEAAERIERGVLERVGVSARVLVVPAATLAEAVAANPLVGLAGDPSRLFVGFLWPDARLDRLQRVTEREWSPEALALGQHAVYVWVPEGFSRSPLMEAVNRALGDGVTMRNWATTLKLLELARG